MWATDRQAEDSDASTAHEGITGVTFDSDAGPCRYVEVEGADHAFAWYRAGLRDLIADWLDETCKGL
jgi:hypothetical protein